MFSKLAKKPSTPNSAEKKEFAVKLGKRIRKYRLARGISQEELAHRSGFYRTYIGHVETGHKSASAYTIWKIAKTLKVTIEELINF
jgi:transcriptional regulator with XRE-family HTH domain